MVERSRVSLPPKLAMKVIVPEPSLSFTRTENAVLCSRPSAMRIVCVGAFRSAQCSEALRANLHVRVFAGAFDIVRDRHARFEFVARRRQGRHTRRDDERSAHQRDLFRRAGRIIRHRHRHHGQRAAEIIRHIVDRLRARSVRRR